MYLLFSRAYSQDCYAYWPRSDTGAGVRFTHEKHNQMSGLKAGMTWKVLQNDKFRIDTKGTELLSTMTHSYDITGHVTRRGT